MSSCSKITISGPRFPRHCLTSSSSRFGVVTGASKVSCFPTFEVTLAPLFYQEVVYEKHQARARAREGRIVGRITDNLDYVNYGVDMWYIRDCKNLYADQLLYAVILGAKKCPENAKTPPWAAAIGVVLEQDNTHTEHEILPPHP